MTKPIPDDPTTSPLAPPPPAPRAQHNVREVFTDLETARAARGLRLVVLTGLPSLWSDAARAICAAKGLAPRLVRFRPGDAAVNAWTGRTNAPVAFFDDEPPIDGWADILALAERLTPDPPLVPPARPERELAHDLCNDLCGAWGLAWCRRLLVIDDSYLSEGRRGFQPPLVGILAQKYGYRAQEVPAARARLVEILGRFDAQLARQRAAGRATLVGEALSAADLYFAAAIGNLAPPPDAFRPILPALRPAFEHLDPELAAALTPGLLAHRDRLTAFLPRL
jgi:glutathione S-transferase